MNKDGKEVMENETPKAIEAWVQEAQLSPDDLDVIIGGLAISAVQCGTYKSCETTYSGLQNP